MKLMWDVFFAVQYSSKWVKESPPPSREEGEGVDAHMCPCGEVIESRTYIVGDCEIYKEKRDA